MKSSASAGGRGGKKLCELCKEEAFVYCYVDAAFLCLECDAKVHQANFLVARHLRHFLCSKCKSSFCLKKQQPSLILGSSLTQTQTQTQTATHLCKACRSSSQNNYPLPSSSSSSSDCLSSSCESSSTDFKPKTKTKPTHSSSTSISEVTISNTDNNNNTNRLEGIFGIWCKKLGLSRHDVVPTATSALRLCLERLAVLPYRVSLAVAFWVGLRMSGGGRSVATWQNLKRLEELSGVPAKLIVALEPKLARVMRVGRRRRIRQDLEEGWAECN